MAIEIGSIAQGKVTGLTRYGAFVALEGGGVGMVHISEISYKYVEDINQHLQVGQEVSVRVLKVDENGRYSLSIKKAQPDPRAQTPRRRENLTPAAAPAPVQEKSAEDSFEDKLKAFMQSSDSRISDLKHNTDRKTGGRKGRR